jgi:DNA-directed RNA polymerase subunit N (RpoN/RPB10)
MIPVKCFTCGAVIADKYRLYLRLLGRRPDNRVKYYPGQDTADVPEKSDEGKLMDEMGITATCCRIHYLTHVDIE